MWCFNLVYSFKKVKEFGCIYEQEKQKLTWQSELQRNSSTLSTEEWKEESQVKS